MANEKVNENVNGSANDVTKAPAVPVTSPQKNEFKEYDVFANRRERKQELDYHRDDDVLTFACPYSVQRYTSGAESEEGRKYYNYAVGYYNLINGKEVPQSIRVVPVESRAEAFDLLDAMFGDADSVPLKIEKTIRTQTINGVSTTSSTYSMCLVAEDEYGTEIRSALVPDGRTSRQAFNNFIRKLAKQGIIN